MAVLAIIVLIFIYSMLSVTDENQQSTEFLAFENEKDLHSTDSRIFFHETSGRSFLTLREVCSVESAARHHPSKLVQIFMSTESIELGHSWNVLNHYKNIQIIPIKNDEYFKGTPLAEWYESKVWESSPLEVKHLNQYIRMVTLWKGGGQYVDLSVLTFKTLDNQVFKDFFLVRDKWKRVDEATFHLSRNHPLIEKIMSDMVKNFDGSVESFEGFALKTFESHCGTTYTSYMNCSDVRLLPHYHFHPNYWLLFDKIKENYPVHNLTERYGMHVTYNVLSDFNQDVKTDAVVSRLAKMHCPQALKNAS